MTIEFRCTQCGKLLRTPEGTSGRKAKCPQCGALLSIPEQASGLGPEPHEPAAERAPPPLVDSPNPYRSPGAAAMEAPPSGEIRRGFTLTRIDLGDVMSRAWQIYKGQFWPCVGTTILFMVVSYGLVFAVALLTTRFNLQGPAQLPLNLAYQAVSIFLTLGLLTYFLKVARGEEAAIGDLFNGGPLLLPAIGVNLLVGLAVILGLLLLIIPGIIVALMLSQSLFVLIDQNTGVIDSLRYSAQATKGNKLTLFGLGFVSMLLSIVGFLACFVGIIFVAPYLGLAYAVAYLTMTGQSTAEQQRADLQQV